MVGEIPGFFEFNRMTKVLDHNHVHHQDVCSSKLLSVVCCRIKAMVLSRSMLVLLSKCAERCVCMQIFILDAAAKYNLPDIDIVISSAGNTRSSVPLLTITDSPLYSLEGHRFPSV